MTEIDQSLPPSVTETSLPPNPTVIVGQKIIDELHYGLSDKQPKQILTGEGSYVPTSLANRLDRRDFLTEVRNNWNEDGTEGKQHYREEYQHFSNIERAFHAPKALELTHPVWGTVTACHTVLNQEASLDHPPIILIPGASNGIESVETLVREMAMQQPDRRVYVLAYPDAPSGVVTSKFADVVKRADGFGPHAELFMAVINHLLPEGDIELWGYSAGAAIASTLLAASSDTAERTTNLLLMNPWGVIKQSDVQVKKGLIEGMTRWRKWFRDLPKWPFVNDPTKGEQKHLKMEIFLELGKKGQKPTTYEKLSRFQLREDGMVAVISGGKDRLTKSADVFPENGMVDYFFPKQRVTRGVVSGAIHEGPLLQAKEFVNLALNRLGR